MEEELEVIKAMEQSDLPKLNNHYRENKSFVGVTWSIYSAYLQKLTKKLQKLDFTEVVDDPNPLITFYTWAFMVPLGGTFCCNV